MYVGMKNSYKINWRRCFHNVYQITFLELPRQMKNLKRLDVSDNKLTSTEEIFEAVKASRLTLEELHAQGNQLEKLPMLNYTTKMLLVLNLSRNR